MRDNSRHRATRGRVLVTGVALAGLLAVAAAPATAIITRTKTGTCKHDFLTWSTVRITWQISDLLVNARAVRTEWWPSGPFGVTPDTVVTDEAHGGVLVTGGRKTWTGPAYGEWSYSYTMPWEPISDGRGRTDVNVTMKYAGAKQCSVRIGVPA